MGESARAAVAADKWQEAQRFYELAIRPEIDIPEAEIDTSAAVRGSDVASVPAAEAATSPDPLPRTEAVASSDASKSEPAEQPRQEQPSPGAITAPAGETGKVAQSQPGSQGAAISVAPPAPRISDEIIKMLIRRGDELLAIGDISAARLVYERAASGGSARAMIALGTTYDPIFLSRAIVRGIRPDPAIATEWYAKAAAMGDAEAASRIERLQALAPR